MKKDDEWNQLYLERLRKDRRFARLPQQQQTKLVKECVQYGIQMAESVGMELMHVDETFLREWCEKQGVQIHKVEIKYDLPYIAEYIHREKKINLYPRRIREMQTLIEKANPEYFQVHSLTEMCLAHELFHHLEYQANGSTGKIVSVSSKLAGIFSYRHYFAEGSEIAAHAFVAELLKLEFSTYSFADKMNVAREV